MKAPAKATKRTLNPVRKRPAAKKDPSRLEAIFALQVRAIGLPTPERELIFHPKRKWRFDFSWPEKKIAVEIDGGTSSQGRHVRPTGYRADCCKMNSAALLGWTVFRGDAVMVKKGTLLEFVEAAINNQQEGKKS